MALLERFRRDPTCVDHWDSGEKYLAPNQLNAIGVDCQAIPVGQT
jgi:hypothetical protein